MTEINWIRTEEGNGVDPEFYNRVLLWDREYDEAVFGSLNNDRVDGKQWILDDEQEIDYEDISHWAECPTGPEEE